MTPLLAELDRVDTQLQEWAPGDLQSIQEILAVRQYVLDRLVPRLADSASDELLSKLKNSAAIGNTTLRRLVAMKHQWSLELGRLSQERSFAEALVDQARLPTAGLDCEG